MLESTLSDGSSDLIFEEEFLPSNKVVIKDLGGMRGKDFFFVRTVLVVGDIHQAAKRTNKI